jgi:hypothetical protein
MHAKLSTAFLPPWLVAEAVPWWLRLPPGGCDCHGRGPLLRDYHCSPGSCCCSVDWSEQTTLTKNYKANKFVLDPNEGFGRNKRSQPLKAKEQREDEDAATFSDDDGRPLQASAPPTPALPP